MGKLLINEYGSIEFPTLILATRSGNKLGEISTIEEESFVCKKNFKGASEISFNVYRELDSQRCLLWDSLTDSKLIWFKEIDQWYIISVQVDESDSVVKSVLGTSLGESELSNIKLFDVEINTEKDIERDDYVRATVFYNEDYPEISLLHRIGEKCPHYNITHVDISLRNIQRQFAFNNITIAQAHEEIEEEIGCLFDYSVSSEGAKIMREIRVYDLMNYCEDCGERFEGDGICPKCDGSNVTLGYGVDTGVFISSENIASSLSRVSNADEQKNCFKLYAGDDLMTATVRNCLPSGDGYLWYFTDSIVSDMSDELATKIREFNSLYDSYKTEHSFSVDSANYNSLVDIYQNDESPFPKIYSPEEEAEEPCIITNNFSQVIAAYYSAIGFRTYLNSSMMPSYSPEETTASQEMNKLLSNLDTVAISNLSNSTSSATVGNAIKSSSQMYVNSSKYSVSVDTSSWDKNTLTWTGYITLTSWNDDSDTKKSGLISVNITSDYRTYVEQVLHKKISNEETDEYDISTLFELEDADFSNQLKKYSLSCLTSFYNCCQTCIDVLIEQGCGNADSELYESIYKVWYTKLKYIQYEIDKRTNEIEILSNGLEKDLSNIISSVHNTLNFQSYIGEDLWKEFCIYRREDSYENTNYISDGLTDAELVENANAFILSAEKEIIKAANLKYTISASVHNLMLIPEFQELMDSFEPGNWIRVFIDDSVHKLRLLSYEINFDAIENLYVEFSEVEKIQNGATDIQSILKKASDISSSYSYVAKQAANGEDANKKVTDWIDLGLATTNAKIISNADNQDWTLDRHGLLMRYYDDLTDQYSDVQLRLVNSSIAFTDDDWETVKAIFGKSIGADGETIWGIIAQHLIGKIIAGNKLIIQSEKLSGDVAEFIVDGDGARLNNAIFNVSAQESGTQITLNPYSGIAIGKAPLYNDDYSIIEENAKLWVDTNGNIRIKINSTDLEEVEIGGTNLIRNSSNLIYDDYYFDVSSETSNSVEAYVLDSPFAKEEECARFLISNIENKFIFHDILSDEQEYTLSFWIKLEENDTSTNSMNSLTVLDKEFQVTNEWTRYCYTFLNNTETNLSFSFSNTGIYFIYHPKLEKGCLATDWTPHPDDLNDGIKNVEKIIEDKYLTVLADSEKLISSALATYVKESDYETYKESVESSFAQTAEEIDLKFERIESLESRQEDIAGNLAEFYKYFKFNSDGLEISSGNSTITLCLDNEKGIIFKNNGIQFGWWDGNDFHTGNIVVELNERAQFGNFAFIPRNDGSLMFNKVSEEYIIN